MKNHVTFETAQRLKAAGFPQPKFDVGQFWWGDTGKLCIITHGGEYRTGFSVLNGLREIWTLEYDTSDPSSFFAPTAADILAALGCEYVFWYDESEKLSMFFVCKTGASYRDAGKPIGHINPAEAAAAAWLAIHEKKQGQ